MVIKRISPPFHALYLFNTSQGKGHERVMDRRALVYVEKGLYFLHLFSGTVIGLPVDDSREVTIPTLQPF